jgi:BppU N-terminal domain
MSSVKIKSGDTAVQFTGTCLQDGAAVDLTGATIKFLMKLVASPNTAYSLTATIVSAAAGTVEYTQGVGFPTVAGKYEQEWEVTFSGGTILTFPNGSYNYVTILDDLN